LTFFNSRRDQIAARFSNALHRRDRRQVACSTAPAADLSKC